MKAWDWPEADQLFRADPHWLGGSDAFSVDLGGGRTLWLFGSSYVDPAGSGDRHVADRVHNSLAVQTGLDPSTASIGFFWREEGVALPFFADEGDEWFTPLHGIRDGGALTLFFSRDRPGGLYSEPVETVAYRIDNPDADPPDWNVAVLAMPRPALSRTQAWISSAARRSTSSFRAAR